MKASPLELLFGTTLRIPGEFFTVRDQPVNPHSFTEHLRDHFRELKPTPTAHHIRAKQFIHISLNTCTHVFLRIDAVKPPLTPPYSGPHRVLQRLDDRRYVIEVKTVNIDRLKPAFVAAEDLVAQPVAQAPRPSRPTV